MENTEVIFKLPISEEIVNFKTGEKCFLVSNEEADKISGKDIEKIVEICNQQAVYDFLFRSSKEGKPYIKENAVSFVKWIVDGWKQQKWFVFFVRDSNGEIVACIDIKSDDKESAEIGYWADYNFPGTISNATKKVIELARKAGFKSLYATARPDNERSKKVLIRNGFVREGMMDKPSGERFKFVFNLE